MASARKPKIPPKKRIGRAFRQKIKAKPLNRRERIETFTTKPEGNNQGAGIFLLAGLALAIAGIYSLPNFHLLLPKDSLVSRLLVHPSLLVLGFASITYALFQLPDGKSTAQMPRLQAYPLFAFFFGLCFFWRFYHPLEPSAPFWFDNQVVTGDIANIIDTHQDYLLFPWGQREPFFPYLTAAIWEILHDVGGVTIVRLSCTLIDLLAIWALYLLGGAVLGRRLGLILMAFWAVSLPMTIWDYFGMGQNTAALAAILVLLFFFRLIQKPSLARFIYWGAALGFGAYCYVPFRPWPPAMITLVLIWIFLGSKEKPEGKAPWILTAMIWVSWIFLFFYKNNYLPSQGALVLLATSSWFLGLLSIGLLAAYGKTWLDRGKNQTNWKVFGWATGVAVMAVMMAPLYLHPLYSQHTTASSVFVDDNGPLPLDKALKAIWHNIHFFFDMMFGQPHEDVSRYPLPGQSYFESFPELCMIIGLAYFIAKPTWKKAVVLIMALVGMTSFIFSNHAHPGRVETCTPTLLLLGAWGLDAFWTTVKREAKDKQVQWAVFILLLGLWSWDSRQTFLGIRNWMAFQSADAQISGQLDKDWRQYRVIIAAHYPEFATPALTVLCDQKEAYVLNDSNPIYLEPGEKGKDIVFYMYGAKPYPTDLEGRVRAEFPQAQWNILECSNPDIHHFMLRAVIPIECLSETPGKLFYIQRVPREYWRRRFYWKDYGVGRGIVWWDERVPVLKAPFPPGMNEFFTARADGEITIPADGEYFFSVNPTADVIVLSIDGREVIHIRSSQGSNVGAKEKINLKSGIHKVTYVTTFRRLTNFADVRIIPSEGGNGWVLGQPALDSHP